MFNEILREWPIGNLASSICWVLLGHLIILSYKDICERSRLIVKSFSRLCYGILNPVADCKPVFVLGT